MNDVARRDQELSANRREFLSRRQHQLRDAVPIAGVDVPIVLIEWMRVHADFGTRLRRFGANGFVTKRGSRRAATNYADVLRHTVYLSIESRLFSESGTTTYNRHISSEDLRVASPDR